MTIRGGWDSGRGTVGKPLGRVSDTWHANPPGCFLEIWDERSPGEPATTRNPRGPARDAFRHSLIAEASAIFNPSSSYHAIRHSDQETFSF